MSLATELFTKMQDKKPATEGEFIQNGLKFCQICKQPRQCKTQVEGMTFTMPTPCECQSKALQAQQAAIQAEKERTKIEKLRRGIADPKYRKMTFEASNIPLDFAHKYVDNFEKYYKDGLGLMLLGTCGTGKTFAAACIANALVEKGFSVYMAHISEIVRQMSQEYSEELPTYINKLKNCSLLIVDDFGTQRSTEFIREKVDCLIDMRSCSCKPLIITSNLQLEDLRESDTSLLRAYDRLKEKCHPITMNGESYRKKIANERFRKMKEEFGC